MSFKKNKYEIIKNAISKDLADFLYKYVLLKRNIYKILINKNFIPKESLDYGYFGDPQVTGKNTYILYGDTALDNLLIKMIPIMEKTVSYKLIPTYTYCRAYQKNDELEKHTDRPECEISTTLNLGGDMWPIYIEPNIEIKLNSGDMLIYSGCDLEHWRKKFNGKECIQVFLHYNKKIKKNMPKLYDNRPSLGMPESCKGAI
jgi:hypothetical protein